MIKLLSFLPVVYRR